MTQAPALVPGAPNWVDLGSPDPRAAAAFYGGLFGWQHELLGPEAGGYGFFRKDGRVVAGIGPLPSEGYHTAWSTYLATDDADDVARRVQAAGGQVLAPPFDVLDAGRMAVFMDPTGAAISVWQPRRMPGAELTGVPGSLVWNELNTRDLGAARAFYTSVFGWEAKTSPMGSFGEYIEWQIEGASRAGAMAMMPQVPAEVPPHWLAYFAVEDTDATADHAAALDGYVVLPPTDSPAGRFAILADPFGATFGVITLAI